MSLDANPLISDWLEIRAGRLLVKSGKVDIGQRISTALLGIVRDELTLPARLMSMAPVRTGQSPDEGITSGSNSIEQSGRALRLAAATLKARALALAAERAGREPGDWTLDDGHATGPGSNHPLPLLDLAAELDLDIPVDQNAETFPPRDIHAEPMRGISDLVAGRHKFVHDLTRPGILHARVVRPPHARATLVSVAAEFSEAIAREDIEIVRDGSFLAVAGSREWPVIRAAERLAASCEWDTGQGLDEGDIFAGLRTDAARRLVVEDGTPREAPIPAPPDAPTYSARYERPFTLHGALAPSAALAVWDGARLDVVTHSQGIYPLRDSIAQSLGLEPKTVTLTHAPGSGCYGHNGADDAAFEASLIAMALPDRPILLKWSREDEHSWEPFGTAMAVELAAEVTKDGRITHWSAEAIGGTFRGRPRPGPNRAGPAKLVANWYRNDPIAPRTPMPNLNRDGGLQRNLGPVYDFGHTRLIKNLVAGIPHRTSALRCLGAAVNVFAIESFVDEIARDRGIDPLDFRREHLSDPRAWEVIDRMQAMAGAAPATGGRGFAYAQYKNAMARVGVAVDVEVTDRAEVRLVRVFLAVDAGRIIDRDGVAAQLEGGFLQGASWALHERVTWDETGITSRDWETYPVLRFDNVPEIVIEIVDRQEALSDGVGEAAPGPAVAAIANAVFDATGLRLRRLPFTPEVISAAALAE